MTENTSRENPLLVPSPLPFELPDFTAIRTEDFTDAFEKVASQILRTVDTVLADAAEPTFANTVEPLEYDGVVLERVLAPFFTLTGANTTPELQAIEEDLAPKLAALDDGVNLNSALLQRITALRTRDDLTAEQAHIVERRIKDMTLAGAGLDEEDASAVRDLNQRIATLGAEFDKRLLADTQALAVVVTDRAELDGLTEAEIDALARPEADGGGYVIALTYPTGHPYLARLTNRALRERIMTASLARCSQGNENDTADVVREIATLRARRAKLLGFDSHAAWTTAGGTAKTTAAVLEMLEPIARAAGANARTEQMSLLEAAKADGLDAIEAWDWPFYAEKVRAAKYDVDVEGLRRFFEAESVLTKGVFAAAQALYGVTFTLRNDLRGWNDDTRVYEVKDEAGESVGLYLLDLYARPEKRGGAWMHELVAQNRMTGQRPVICNNLNVAKPGPGERTYLTFDETSTLFHEFGHALHGLLTDVQYPSVSGTNVERDFVEFPSQVNEMWMLWPDVVTEYAKDPATGETLPADVLKRLAAAETFNQGFATSELVGAALLDFSWHMLDAEAASTTDVASFGDAVREKYGLDNPAVPSRYAAPYFQHIFSGGYSAGYYGYLWAEVLDADAVEWFRDHGGLTRENGRRFADELLSVGGSKDSMQAYVAFRGREPEVAPLLRRRGLAGGDDA